ncbi:MAG: DUF2380 domain-containing protein [Gammaproteobacteria bacterium]|nr:DUF2380 domain-containing protein [Gammaproteobacteria bacterium]
MVRQLIRVVVIILGCAITVLPVLSPILGATEQKTGDVRSIAFFGFRLINTSMEPAGEPEYRRIKLLDAIIEDRMKATGRYTIVPVPEDVLRDVAKGQDFGQCQCEADYGKKVGAQYKR